MKSANYAHVRMYISTSTVQKQHTCIYVRTYTCMYTVEPLFKDTPELKTPPLIRTPCTQSQLHGEVYKTTPEMRTPPLLEAVSRVFGIEELHCTCVLTGNTCTCIEAGGLG